MRRGAAGAVCAWLALALCGAAAALTFPGLSGRVVDEAGLLDPAARSAISQSLAELEARTTTQLVVVTLKSLQGTSIEDFGYQLGRRWGIGQEGRNNGALLIVAPNERKVRIEVGYGLEGTLTDAISRLIIENSILPRFKAGDFPGGIRRGVEDLVQVLGGDAAEWQRRAQRPPVDYQTLFAIAMGLLIVLAIVLERVFGSRPRRRGRSGWWSGGGFSWSSGGSSNGGSSFSGGGGSFGGGGSSGSW